jgi:hypothetical protein
MLTDTINRHFINLGWIPLFLSLEWHFLAWFICVRRLCPYGKGFFPVYLINVDSLILPMIDESDAMFAQWRWWSGYKKLTPTVHEQKKNGPLKLFAHVIPVLYWGSCNCFIIQLRCSILCYWVLHFVVTMIYFLYSATNGLLPVVWNNTICLFIMAYVATLVFFCFITRKMYWLRSQQTTVIMKMTHIWLHRYS